jgi:hypothetical protein
MARRESHVFSAKSTFSGRPTWLIKRGLGQFPARIFLRTFCRTFLDWGGKRRYALPAHSKMQRLGGKDFLGLRVRRLTQRRQGAKVEIGIR